MNQGVCMRDMATDDSFPKKIELFDGDGVCVCDAVFSDIVCGRMSIDDLPACVQECRVQRLLLLLQLLLQARPPQLLLRQRLQETPLPSPPPLRPMLPPLLPPLPQQLPARCASQQGLSAYLLKTHIIQITAAHGATW